MQEATSVAVNTESRECMVCFADFKNGNALKCVPCTNKNPQYAINGLELVETETRKCCISCLESLANGETLIRLTCSHIYHSDCFDPWLEIHGDCPYCRRLVIHVLEEEPKPILNWSLSWFETLLVFMGLAVTY